MSHHADTTAPKPRAHHYMNADGFCHGGDMFKAGTPFVALYDADELVRLLNVEKAEAWQQSANVARERGWLVAMASNPYREARP